MTLLRDLVYERSWRKPRGRRQLGRGWFPVCSWISMLSVPGRASFDDKRLSNSMTYSMWKATLTTDLFRG